MREAGFTLLEVVVAFTVVTLVLGAGYAAMGAGAKGAGRAEAALDAVTLAESLLARAGHDIPLVPGEREGVAAPFAWTLTVDAATGGAAIWGRLGHGPVRVTASVTHPIFAPVTLETLRGAAGSTP